MAATPTVRTRSGDASHGGPRGRARLLAVGAGQLVTRALGPAERVILGRDADCDLCLDSVKISRRHAAVRGGSPVTVEDLGSTNGVRVRGARVRAHEAVPLTAGESFQLGPFFVLLLSEPAGKATADDSDPRASLEVGDPTAGKLSEIVTRIARSPVSVLIRGETGVGKDVLARSLHAASGRAGALVPINCAALSETLLESELFGHERGAFTGAVAAKPGLLETARGGTVFLDEIAEMPPAVQAKLLRALETRQVWRVGGVKPVELDVRFLAATHRDLRQAVASGAFRQDLYHRLHGITLVVPPLRQRRGTIAPLALEFLKEPWQDRTAPARIHPDALAALSRHDFPGNVRELRNVLQRARLLAHEGEIRPEHLVFDEEPPAGPASEVSSSTSEGGDERARIIAALEECAGNQTRAARRLGISRSTLATRLALHRIPRPRIR